MFGLTTTENEKKKKKKRSKTKRNKMIVCAKETIFVISLREPKYKD